MIQAPRYGPLTIMPSSACFLGTTPDAVLPPSTFGARRLALGVASHRVSNACLLRTFYVAVLGMLLCGIYAALLRARSAFFGSLGADQATFLPSFLGQALLLSSDQKSSAQLCFVPWPGAACCGLESQSSYAQLHPFSCGRHCCRALVDTKRPAVPPSVGKHCCTGSDENQAKLLGRALLL